MKNKNLYAALGILIIASLVWKSCRKDDSEKHPAPGKPMSQNGHGDRKSKSRLQEIQDFFQNADIKMDFFGKVIDQDGQGVGDVTIHYIVGKAGNYLDSGIIKNTNEKKKIQSNADGRFEIKGAKGLTLSIGPLNKSGYRDGLKNPRSFGFNSTPELHQANSQKPVDFVIVRSDVPKTKEIYQKRLRFAWNQGEVRIPLGSKLGDWVLVPTRSDKTSGLRDFDWNVKVSMDRAELVSLEEYYAPIAPSDGYQTAIEYGTNKGDDKRPGGASKTYAFKTTDGLYGVVRLSVYPDREDFVVNGSLDVRLNESGSRNLD